MATADIVLLNLTKAFGGHTVFRGVNLKFAHGCNYCLMGPSGCGKTTLLHILCGLLAPDAGGVQGMDGRFVAPVFQDDRLIENLSAASNIRFAARQKLTDMAIENMMKELMLDCWRQSVWELSGGMKRRVAIARALLSGGDVFLLDEPFKGLDEETKARTMDAVQNHTLGKTTIWVTHDAQEAAYLRSKIIRFPLI